MKKILKKVLLIIICVIAFGLTFMAGYQTAISDEQKEVAENISKNSVQPTQKKIYVVPEDDKGIVAEYSDDNKLVKVDRYPIFSLNNSNPINDITEKYSVAPFATQMPKPTATPEPTPEPIMEEPSETLLGSDFKLYHYAPTGSATASGRMPVVGTTVAVDPSYIKLGTWLRIEIPDGNGGYKVYKQKVRADDTGGDIKGHVLDIFVSSESEARQCGVIRNARVYTVEE